MRLFKFLTQYVVCSPAILIFWRIACVMKIHWVVYESDA